MLLCALFLRHVAALVRSGHVFVATPPLSRVDVGKQMLHCLGETDRETRTGDPAGRAGIGRSATIPSLAARAIAFARM